MPRKIRFLGEVRLDVFEAIKRSYIRRGFIRKKPKLATETKPDKPTKADQAGLKDPKPEPPPAKLVDLTVKAQDTLFEADTVFPFTLFPDTVRLDREKLTIANRIFFRIAKVTSVPIADILSVEVDVGLFFGSVKLRSRYFFTNPRSVTYLWRHDAVKLQRLLQGYIIAHERKVDCTAIQTKDLVILLNDLGQGASD